MASVADKIGVHFAGQDMPPYFQDKCTPGNLAIEFSIETGVRAGGIVDLNRNNITEATVDGELIYFIKVTEKGSRSREIPLSPRALEIIALLESLAENVDRFIEPHLQKNKKIFYDRIDKGYLFFFFSRSDSVSKMFRRAAKATGIDATFHNCRDTFATRFLEAGGNLETLSELLGHVDIKTTLNHYGHITRAKKVREMRKVFKD